MPLRQNPALSFFSSIFTDIEEVVKKVSPTGVSFSFALGDTNLVWSSRQVGEDAFEIISPLFFLKFLEIEDDFRCGKDKGKSTLSSEEIGILEEDFEDEISSFNSFFSLISLFCYSVQEITGELPSIDKEKPLEDLSLCSFHEINKKKRYDFDLFYSFREKYFSFVLTIESYQYAVEIDSFDKTLQSYFNRQHIARCLDSDDDLRAEISVEKMPKFFVDLNTFVDTFNIK